MEPLLATFWTTFGALLDPIWGQKWAPEGDQKWDHFWDPLAPHLRGLALTFSGIIREVWKGYWNWNYTLQKKGRDFESFLGYFGLFCVILGYFGPILSYFFAIVELFLGSFELL